MAFMHASNVNQDIQAFRYGACQACILVKALLLHGLHPNSFKTDSNSLSDAGRLEAFFGPTTMKQSTKRKEPETKGKGAAKGKKAKK